MPSAQQYAMTPHRISWFVLGTGIALCFLLLGCTNNSSTKKGNLQCKEDAECAGAGKYCLKGRCAQCNEDRQCPEGHYCSIESFCELSPGYCAHNIPCPPPQRCRTNLCGVQCYKDNECGPDQSCRRSLCVANADCVADVDCPLNMLCNQGICQRGQGCLMAEVFFDLDESSVQIDALPTLEHNVKCLDLQLANHPNLNASIIGHADEQGGVGYNLKLSKQRADSVRDTLMRMGLNPKRLRSVGKGESDPAFRGANSISQHQLNRRVEFRLRP